MFKTVYNKATAVLETTEVDEVNKEEEFLEDIVWEYINDNNDNIVLCYSSSKDVSKKNVELYLKSERQ